MYINNKVRQQMNIVQENKLNAFIENILLLNSCIYCILNYLIFLARLCIVHCLFMNTSLLL